MSLIADVIGDLIVDVVGAGLDRLFHATGRRLIWIATLGRVRIPSAGRGEDERAFTAKLVGFFFWLAVAAGLLLWALA